MFERVKKVFASWFSGDQPDENDQDQHVAIERSDRPNRVPVIIPREDHCVSKANISGAALKTVRTLQQAGYKAYIVGGAVRDLALGKTPKDFDVVTDATPEQIKKCFRRSLIIGRRFRLVHVLFGRETIECATFRSLDSSRVRKDIDGRVISDNAFGEMWEDAARRDFTINALYYDPKAGEIIDYHGGWEDIRRKCVRIIGTPEERYREDPVRMMRAIRIACKLGFDIEPGTQAPFRAQGKLLGNIPSARLFDEMLKIFTCGNAKKCIEMLVENRMGGQLLPLWNRINMTESGRRICGIVIDRTDRRVRDGKSVSPSFLYAALLWPLVRVCRDKNLLAGMTYNQALVLAGRDVLSAMHSEMPVSARVADDMSVIWQMQAKFERKNGSVKTAYSLIGHPRYRPGYDFFEIRAEAGEVDPAEVAWWDKFAYSNDLVQTEMIAEKMQEMRNTGAMARTARTRNEYLVSQIDLSDEEEKSVKGVWTEVAPIARDEDGAGEKPKRKRRRRRPAGNRQAAPQGDAQ